MNIIVTGGAGFIGSHLVDRIISEGHNVTIIDDLSTGKEEFINKKAKFYKTKIQNDLTEIFEKTAPDIIYHLAAQIQVKKSIDNPIEDAETNIIGTINLLKLAIKFNVKKFIFSSSGGVMYGNFALNAKEDEKENPINPYGISKLAAEKYIKFYSKYGFKYSILRYANVYGPRQTPKGEAGVVPLFIENMLKNIPCTLYGFGKLTRDYIYIDDVVDASIDPPDNEIVNIGTNISTSVNEIFNLIKKEINNYSISPIYKQKREGEVEENSLNCDKLNKINGWKPKILIDEGIKKTIQWIKKNLTLKIC